MTPMRGRKNLSSHFVTDSCLEVLNGMCVRYTQTALKTFLRFNFDSNPLVVRLILCQAEIAQHLPFNCARTRPSGPNHTRLDASNGKRLCPICNVDRKVFHCSLVVKITAISGIRNDVGGSRCITLTWTGVCITRVTNSGHNLHPKYDAVS